jgi:hypothetical protein
MRYRTKTLIVIVGAAVICASVVIANDAKTQILFGLVAPARKKEVPRQKGERTIKIIPHNLPRYDDVNQLTKASTAIFVGSVISQKSTLTSESENTVSTHYKVLVKDVLKGDVKKGATTDIRMAGAESVSVNGADVDVKIPDYWKMPQTNATYVFFLQKTDFDDYAFVGGPQGMFQVSSNVIKPQGLAEDALYLANKDLELKNFLQKVRAALAG